jgi:hypothetical protein
MRWQHPALEKAQDAILVLFVKPSDTLTYDPADPGFPRVSSHIATKGSMPILTVILAIAFVDNGTIGTPHAAHLAADLFSFIVARRPASCFGVLDPQPAVEAVMKLLFGIFNRVKGPHCLVEECFGTVQVPCHLPCISHSLTSKNPPHPLPHHQVINVLPLLYYLCDWPDSIPHVRLKRLPETIFSLATNMVHNWAQERPRKVPNGSRRNDCPIDIATFPELHRARIHIWPLLGPSSSALLHRQIFLNHNP